MSDLISPFFSLPHTLAPSASKQFNEFLSPFAYPSQIHLLSLTHCQYSVPKGLSSCALDLQSCLVNLFFSVTSLHSNRHIAARMVYESESITSPLKSLPWLLFHHHHLEFSAGRQGFVHRLLFPSCTLALGSVSHLSKTSLASPGDLCTFTKKVLLIYISGHSFDITCSSWRPSLTPR